MNIMMIDQLITYLLRMSSGRVYGQVLSSVFRLVWLCSKDLIYSEGEIRS
jgi:hypothetical protein